MLFNSGIFALFFALFFPLYFLVRKSVFWRNVLLIVASYIAGQKRVLRLGLNFAYAKDIHEYVTRVAYLYRRNRWETLLREGVETR